MDGLNEARAEQLNRVKITEKEVEALEGAKAEAEALQAKERELRQKKAALYQLAVHEAQENLSGLARKHQALAEKLEYERVRDGGMGGCMHSLTTTTTTKPPPPPPPQNHHKTTTPPQNHHKTTTTDRKSTSELQSQR